MMRRLKSTGVFKEVSIGDNPYALPISILPEGGIYQRKDYRMLGVDFRATASWNHLRCV